MQQNEQTARRGDLAAKYGWQLAFTLTLASFYLIGEVYWDSYLTHFHLEPSMFPISVPSTYIESVWAFGNGLGALLNAINQAAHTHGLKIVLVWFGFSAALGVAYFLKGIKKRSAPPKSSEEGRWLARLALAMLRGWSVVTVGAAVPLVSIVGLAMFLVMLIGPFTKLGAQIAAQDAAKGFPDQPTVVLRASDGGMRDYRVIVCGGDYCALFRDGRAFAVKKDEIDWAVPQAATH